jgi:hypothetical protein
LVLVRIYGKYVEAMACGGAGCFSGPTPGSNCHSDGTSTFRRIKEK